MTLSFDTSVLDPEWDVLFYRFTGGSGLEVQGSLLSGSHFEYYRRDTDAYETSVASADLGQIDRLRAALEGASQLRPLLNTQTEVF